MRAVDCLKLDKVADSITRTAARMDAHEARRDAADKWYTVPFYDEKYRLVGNESVRAASPVEAKAAAQKLRPRQTAGIPNHQPYGPSTRSMGGNISGNPFNSAKNNRLDAYEARRDAAPIDVARNKLRRLESQLGSGTPVDQNKWRAEIKELKEKVRRLSASGGGPLSGSEKRGDATPTPAKKTSEYVGPKDAKGVEAVLNRRGAKNDGAVKQLDA